MQVIYGAGNASNPLLTAQKRLIRPVYAQTQGFPYAATLDPSFRNSDGSFRMPLGADTTPLARGGTAPFTSQNSITPGQVLVKSSAAEAVVIGTNAASLQPMGLLGQWLGGTFDNVGQTNQVGVWMGPDSVYDLLAPAWNDTGLSGIINAAGAGIQVPLYCGSDGRLTGTQGTATVPVARVIQRISNAVLRIQLLV